MVLYEFFAVTIGEITSHLTAKLRILLLYPKKDVV